MKQPAVSKDLVPVHEFRTHLAEWILRASESGRPVVVTQRGKAAAILVSPSLMDEIDEEREVVRRVLLGLKEVEEGKLTDDAEVWKEAEEIISRAERERADSVD